ncbi:MAG: hypothetical protein ACPL4H_10690 [Anaerolineales bacterium]
MACINPDGSLSPTAKLVLQTVSTPKTAQEIAQIANIPLYRVRGSLRELLESGLLNQLGETYQISEKGKQLL